MFDEQDANAKLVENATGVMLSRLTETWTEHDDASLSEAESNAIQVLALSGMVESCICLRFRLVNHPVAFEVTGTATGMELFPKPLHKAFTEMTVEWGDALREWRAGANHHLSPLLITNAKPSKFRLTKTGVSAAANWVKSANTRAAVWDYMTRVLVLVMTKKPVADGKPFVPPRSDGQLIEVRRVQAAPQKPMPVAIANAGELVQAFLKAADQFGMSQPLTAARPDGNRHGPGFRSVVWNGDQYSFTEMQGKCIEVLWNAYYNGTPDVSDVEILGKVDSQMNKRRLVHLFQGHKAWGTMIVDGETKGTRRLSSPKNPIPPKN